MNATPHDLYPDSGAEVAAGMAPVDTTAMATETTLLNPRFYTTDFDEMDKIDVTPVRAEWDRLIAQMKSDPNKGHFKKTEAWDKVDWEGMDPPLRRELIDFLVSSCTAEFSGCVLYKEMKRRGSNPDICELFSYMSREEARHAGFINDALREAGVAVNLGFLTAVYSTMWVRDHARPKFHKALGVDIGWYDQEVLRKTSTIARQIFPVEIDIDHPRWIPNLKRMNAAFIAMDEARKQGGIGGKLKGWGAAAKAALAFASPYLIPVRKQDLPANVRLEPSY